MTRRTAIVTGVEGQDGSFLSELLLAEGYDVVGVGRTPAAPGKAATGLRRVACDITQKAQIEDLLRQWRPTEFYNLAGLSSGAGMFDDAVRIGEINGLAVAGMLEAIRAIDPTIRFAQASSSEVFALAGQSPQTEDTAHRPRSPYGAAKVYADTMLRIYRERYGLFACSAILFNHESPRRRPEFVTRKITQAAAAIKLGLMSHLELGSLDAKRDWGFAGDYMHAMWLMLQHPRAQDYVIATGRLHSVRELCEIAFSHLGLDYRDVVSEGTQHGRSADQTVLVGNAARAQRDLQWIPRVDFRSMVTAMVEFDLHLLSKHSLD